ncbi:MAG: hypothetical protein HC764_05370 [Pleurocapsa sp. CRU_1_2]|nr:hypothetical protein [Pleurocapsa sp. CRU_1_2]
MSKNLLLENIISIDDFFTIPQRVIELEKNSLECQIPGSIYQFDEKYSVDSSLVNNPDNPDNYLARGIDNNNEMAIGKDNNIIYGKGISSALSIASASAEAEFIADYIVAANSQTTANAGVLALGINNVGKINTGRGNDIIFGVADASGNSTADSQAESILSNVTFTDATSSSVGAVNVVVDAVGINNDGKINTGKGDDVIIGFANASALGNATTNSQTQLLFSNGSTATANSESVVIVDSLALGINNTGVINTGEGHDVIIGLGTNSAVSEAVAAAFAYNAAILATGCDPEAIEALESAITQSTSLATAVSTTTTLGIINSGQILTSFGDDVIIGLANNQSSSNAQTISVAESAANDTATATADAQSLAIAQGSTVGIVNLGQINTGKGNDIVIGIAIDKSAAVAGADANAVSTVNNSDAQANTSTFSDTSQAIAIGIDNTGGKIFTAIGDDQVVGVGEIGILGGSLNTGLGNDQVIAYGSTIGVQDSEIRLGQGDDFFKAAIVDFDPVTGAISFPLDQSSSIKNTSAFGDRGNDTFEISNFEGNVLIDGGKDFDVLRLWGNLDNYQFTGSSDNRTLTIEDSDSGSVLTVKNIEAVYYGDSDQAYKISDFA